MLWLAVSLLLAGAYGAKRRLSTAANPVTFFSVGLAAPLCARAVVDSTGVDWEGIVGLCIRSEVSARGYGVVFAMVLSGWLAFCLPWAHALLVKRVDKVMERAPADPLGSKDWTMRNMLPVIVLLLIAYASYRFGYLPLWQMVQGALDVRVMDAKLHELPLGIMAMITVLTMVYALDTTDNLMSGNRRLRRYGMVVAIALLLFFAVWNGKRQLLLFIAFVYGAGYLYRWDRLPSFRNDRRSPYFLLPVLGVMLAASFVLIDHLRYEKGWSRPLSAFAYLSWPASNQLSMADALGFGKFDAAKALAIEHANKGIDGQVGEKVSLCRKLAPTDLPAIVLPPIDESVIDVLESSQTIAGPPITSPTVADMPTASSIANSTIPFVLTELLPHRFGGRENLKAIRPVLHEPTSPSGFLTYWWLDGGLPFVLLGGFLFGKFSLWAYRRRLESHAHWQFYVLVLWATATSGIYNHFIALIYFWLPLAFIYARVLFRRARHA